VRARPGSRLWLHAFRLSLAHPVTGAPLALEAPPPGDLAPPSPAPGPQGES